MGRSQGISLTGLNLQIPLHLSQVYGGQAVRFSEILRSMDPVTDLLGLLVLAATGGYLIEAMRSKDFARTTAKQYCRERDVQLLDDTVHLRKLRLCRDPGGRVVVYREFGFEFTVDGSGRQSGDLVLHGRRLASLSLGSERVWMQ
jgi:hypothetical protein